MLMNASDSPGPGGQPVPSFGRFTHAPESVLHYVLVVDDDASFAQTVVDALCDRDIEAIAVTDPREALGKVRRHKFAAAVVDLVMPEMDGLDLARELRRASPSTEVVMLTGHADMHSAIEGIRNELFDYLQKDSLQPARLRRAVRAAIARSELRAENRRLVGGLQETTRKLRVLGEVTTRLAAEQHLDKLLSELVGAARELLEAEAARLILTDRSDLGDVTIRLAVGDGEVALGGHFGAGDGIAAGVIDSGTAVRAESAREYPSYSPRCDELGASLEGFLCVPLGRPTVTGVLMAAGRARPFSDDDLELLGSLARQGAVAIENVQAAEVSQNFFTHASALLVSLLDAQDIHYQGHSRAVAALADMVTRRLGLSDVERRNIHFAALLHDVGKLRLHSGLLAADGPLTAQEVELVRQHPSLGVEMLRPISRWSVLSPAIHTHHERWDGRGYPRGLSGAGIPLGGRVIAIAEAFEAMTRPLPHRTARSIDDALAEIASCGGSQFDPVIAPLFVEEYRINRERLERA